MFKYTGDSALCKVPFGTKSQPSLVNSKYSCVIMFVILILVDIVQTRVNELLLLLL